ncbi:MAG: hypothetical protein ACFFA5_03150 [Promethearchaeota archaeon]
MSIKPISRVSAKHENNLKEMRKASVHHKLWNLVSLLLTDTIPEAIVSKETTKTQLILADFLYQQKIRGEQIWQSF